jgi:predicted TIM-barrel fold metal-dependent hydrolase
MTGTDVIVDAHHHLWDTTNNPYPWLEPAPPEEPVGVLGDLTGLPRPFLIEDYLGYAKPLGIVQSVHVEALWGGDPVDETRWVQGVADEHGFPHGIVAHADLSDLAVSELLDRHLEFANVRGIRQCVNWHDDPGKRFCLRGGLMSDGQWRRGFAELATRQLSFDLFCNAGQLEEAADLAQAFPDTQIVLEHTGTPVDRDPAGLATWERGIRLMAAAPNVVVKLSGLGMTDHRWTVDSIRPFIHTTIEVFGEDRCMFGTNAPADLLYGPFDRIVKAFLDVISDASVSERRAVLGQTAQRTYRLPPV